MRPQKLFKLTLILIGLTTTVCFWSCQNSNSEKPAIVFWHFWSEPSQKNIIESLVKEFEFINHCTVELSELSWNDGKTKLTAAFNSNTAPDVLELGSDWIAQFSSSTLLENIPLEKLNAFYHYALPPAKWNNNYYALPWTLDSRAMFVNNDLLKKNGIENPPLTFDELSSLSSKISLTSTEEYIYGVNGDDPHRLYKKILPIIWSFGGDVFNADGKLHLNSESNIRAVEYYANLAKYGVVETQRQIDQMFVQGKIAICFSGSWLPEKIDKTNPTLDYTISLMPGRESNSGISFAGGEYLAVNSQSKNKELSFKLIEFLTSRDNVIKFCSSVNEAGFPADSAASLNDVFTKHPVKKIFAEQLKQSKMTPMHEQWLEIEHLIETAVVETILSKKSARQAMNDAQQSAMKIIKISQ